MRNKYHLLLLLSICCPAIAAEQPASASSGGLFQVLLVLFLVLALMVGAAWVLKKFNARGTTPGSTIRIVGGVAVGSRERIMVVEVADQWIVVGVTSGSINALSSMPKQEAETKPEEVTVSNNFASKLKQFIENRNAK